MAGRAYHPVAKRLIWDQPQCDHQRWILSVEVSVEQVHASPNRWSVSPVSACER